MLVMVFMRVSSSPLRSEAGVVSDLLQPALEKPGAPGAVDVVQGVGKDESHAIWA